MSVSPTAKSILTSKTVWANIFGIAATVATATGHLPVAAVLSDPQTQSTVLAVGGCVVNLVLRLVTKQPVAFTK